VFDEKGTDTAMSKALWKISIAFIIALHVTSLIVSVMSMMMVHRYDRSNAFKDVLLAGSGVTVFLAAVGAVLVFTGLSRGWFDGRV